MKGFKKLSSFVLCAALFAALAAGGCGGSSEDSAAVSSKAVMHGDVPEVIVKAIEKDPEVPVTHIFGENYICSVAADSVEQKEYLDAYNNHAHFVLIRPTEAEIEHFLTLINREGSTELAYLKGYAGTTLLGIENEKDGDSHIFIASGEAEIVASTDTDTPLEAAAEVLRGTEETEEEIEPKPLLVWLKSGEKEYWEPNDDEEEVRLRRGDKAIDLDKIVSSTKLTVWTTFSRGDAFSKEMTINNFIKAVHKFSEDRSGGEDYYLITQQCILDGSSGYVNTGGTETYTTTLDGNWYKIWRGGVIDNYMYLYRITNILDLKPTTSVLPTSPLPTSLNKTGTTTVTKGWSSSGSLGFESGGKGSTSLSGGFESSQSQTFDTDDAEVSMTNKNKGTVITWEHNLKKPYPGDGISKKMYEGAKLGYTSYNPVHMWVWGGKEMTEARRFKIHMYGEAGTRMIRFNGLSSKEITKSFSDDTLEVELPVPPRFAIEGEKFDFENEQQTQLIKIHSESDWSVIAENIPDWIISLGKNEGADEVEITIKENTTGKKRSYSFCVKAEDEEKPKEIKIHQFPGKINK